MSMNLHLKATVQSTLHLKSGDVRRKTVEHFDLWQTPTVITNEAMASSNPLEVYLKWLLVIIRPNMRMEHEMRIEHEQELMEWLKEHQGWDIEWYDM